MEEKEVQLQRQVGTMMKMDTDVERLVHAINAARNKFVADIRATLGALFERARADEVMLLDTVVRENRFFQTRIGHALLAPRVAALGDAIASALASPVQLRMETTYSFPSVPRAELDALMRDYSRSSGGVTPLPSDASAQTRLVASGAEADGDAHSGDQPPKYIHWEPGMLRQPAADDPASELAGFDWRQPPLHGEWSAWVDPMNVSTQASSMLADSGPARVTFNSPGEVLLSQSARTRRHRDFLSLERLPAVPPGGPPATGPPQRTRRPLELSAADSVLMRPSSAPPRRRMRVASPPPTPEVASLQQRVIVRNSLVASPQKGFALPPRQLRQEDEEEQRIAAAVAALGVPPPQASPRYSIEPIRGGLRAGVAGGTERPQFYRIAGAVDGDGEPLQPSLSPRGPPRRPSSADGPLEASPSPMYRPIVPTAVRLQSGRAGQVGLTGLLPSQREQAAAEALAHLPPGPAGAPRHAVNVPRLAIPEAPEDQVGELGMVLERDPRVSGPQVRSRPYSPLSRSAPSSPGTVSRSQTGDGAPRSPTSPPSRPSLAQTRHAVASEFALYSAAGRPEVQQQQLVSAVQDARERWAAERRRRLDLEARLAELEGRTGEPPQGAPAPAAPASEAPSDVDSSAPASPQPLPPAVWALVDGAQLREEIAKSDANNAGDITFRASARGGAPAATQPKPRRPADAEDAESAGLGGWSAEASGEVSYGSLPHVHNLTEAAPLGMLVATPRLGGRDDAQPAP